MKAGIRVHVYHFIEEGREVLELCLRHGVEQSQCDEDTERDRHLPESHGEAGRTCLPGVSEQPYQVDQAEDGTCGIEQQIRRNEYRYEVLDDHEGPAGE